MKKTTQLAIAYWKRYSDVDCRVRGDNKYFVLKLKGHKETDWIEEEKKKKKKKYDDGKRKKNGKREKECFI